MGWWERGQGPEGRVWLWYKEHRQGPPPSPIYKQLTIDYLLKNCFRKINLTVPCKNN